MTKTFIVWEVVAHWCPLINFIFSILKMSGLIEGFLRTRGQEDEEKGLLPKFGLKAFTYLWPHKQLSFPDFFVFQNVLSKQRLVALLCSYPHGEYLVHFVTLVRTRRSSSERTQPWSSDPICLHSTPNLIETIWLILKQCLTGQYGPESL